MTTPIKRSVITAATVEPVTLAEAKAHLRIDNADSDTEISAMISAARDSIEQQCNRYWTRQVVAMTFSELPGSGPLIIPLPDIDSVDAVTYTDTAGDTQTLTGAVFDTDRQTLRYSAGWPIGSDARVVLTVGPDLSASPPEYVPPAIKAAILMTVADLYEHRTAQMGVTLNENLAVSMLLTPYRVGWGV